MRSGLLLALMLCVGPVPVRAQARLETQVDTSVIHVGDRITMTVSVDHAAASRAQLPDSLALSPFEALSVEQAPDQTTDGGVRSTFRLALTAFELGDLEIPSIPVAVVAADGVADTLHTDPYGVQVVSVGTDESGDIRDIQGPLGIPMAKWILALWLILPWLIVAALYLLVKRLRPRGEDKPSPALGELARPPHEVALEALASLEASGLLERGQVKEYHIAASDILRTYVEARFRVDALEMTTREVLDGLSSVRADPQFRVGLRTFLEACDLVKFAKARPDAEASKHVLELGRRIILESVPAAHRAAPEPATVGAGEEA